MSFRNKLDTEREVIPLKEVKQETKKPKTKTLKFQLIDRLEKNEKYKKITEKNKMLTQVKQMGDLSMF